MTTAALSPVRPVLEARARLGEGPVWDDQAQGLYWVDIYNHRVHRFDPATGDDRFWTVDDTVGAIALTHDQRLIMALRKQLAFLDLQDGSVTPIIQLEEHLPNNRFNDGKCDAAGRFWFGSMCPHGEWGNLYRYSPDGTLSVMETGLCISNGLGWSPDQRTFYLADSHDKTIFAYDFDLDTGNITRQRVCVDLTAESFAPDGLTIDAEGCIWAAMWDGWCIIRFRPDGTEIERVPMPVQRPTSCTFGGTNGRSLYITSASVGLSEAEIQNSFLSGDLFRVETAVSGLPTYRFGQ